ncbi:response regulator transcription factor [Paenibacillus filicis]|uniref:Response regulator transcription factor n=1 Tax=Paenibacillus filicis TaxID=669464 RepID=A0ABU9DU20_9BACL
MKKTSKPSIRILIVDDQFLTREGLKTILDLEDDLEVVGMAKNGADACEEARALRPDIVLMDIRMPVMDGIESIKRIKSEFPEMIILILTTFVEEDYIIEGLSSGASGYILKDMEGDRMVNSIRDAAAGQFVLQGVIAVKLATRLAQLKQENGVFSARRASLSLTEREAEVARLMIQGLSNREIGETLVISDGTVRNYISTLYSKLEVNNRAEAIVHLLKETNMPM